MPRRAYFAGLSPELVEGFVERVKPSAEFGAAIERWKVLTREGWEVTALAGEEGGQVVELVAVGFRHLEAAESPARLSA